MKTRLILLSLLIILFSACKRDRNNDMRALKVTSFWPTSGNAGTIVTMYGQGFGKNTTIAFNGKEAKVTDARDTILMALVPEGGSTGMVVVKDGESKIDAGNYTYQQLSMQRVAPLNGPAGTNISIYGAGFSSLETPATVTINGKAAVVTSIADTVLVAAIPANAGTGKIVVTVDGKMVEGPNFTYQQINSMKPLKGGAGTEVMISGTGFETTNTGNTVTFNGKAATIISAQTTQLLVKVPEGVSSGPVALTINGQKTVGQQFTVVPKPLINVVAPLSGPASTTIDIAGDNFSTFNDEVIVTINGQQATIVTTTEKQISVKVPAGAGTGKLVVTVNGQQSDGPVFKEQALGVKQLIPDNGLAGTEVLVKGMGFNTNAASNIVTIGSLNATVTAATDSTLKIIVPTGVSTGLLKVTAGTLDATGPEFRRAGVVTIAGGPQLDVFADPMGVVADSKGNYFVVDRNVVKKVTADGVVSIFAGRADNSAGNAEGYGTNAAFNYINNIVIDAQDNMYVSDGNNRAIRKITAAGQVSTFAKVTLFVTGLGIDKNGLLYYGGQYNGLFKIDALGNSSKLGVSYTSPPGNIAINNAGVVYFAGDNDNPYVYSFTDDLVSRYAGSTFGYNNGSLTTAQFASINGIAYNRNTNEMYLAENSAIRYIKDGQVTRIAGWNGGSSPAFGFVDGTLAKSLFNNFYNIALDKEGNLLVVERYNKSLRKIILR
ncbi:IPT/TIG domain-containing protein [Chitinophaga sp. Hz27]|uniref:IPT/TIG domain-containing protein n=1 Tax=Chitinophaga sp. Hz27 TaxID=3347169 RepID=UPI0035DD20DF